MKNDIVLRSVSQNAGGHPVSCLANPCNFRPFGVVPPPRRRMVWTILLEAAAAATQAALNCVYARNQLLLARALLTSPAAAAFRLSGKVFGVDVCETRGEEGANEN